MVRYLPYEQKLGVRKREEETEEKGKCDRHITGLHDKIAPRISETLFITTADNQPM